MFSPRTPVGRSRASPFTTSQNRPTKSSNAATPRRTLNLTSFSNRNQSNVAASQSLHTSQLFEETYQHRVETFGAPLPVLITEALNLSDRSTTGVTACLDPSGWAWLVGNRSLFVWRYPRPDGGSRLVQCKELKLPPSYLAYSAERVCVIPRDGEGQTAACVAVSPEGIVRYWPNVAFESSTAEISAELKGEECAMVINFQPFGCLLATTTSSLLLLELVPGQAGIRCKPLKVSVGLFEGIHRRISSLVFQTQPVGAPLQTILAAPEEQNDEDDDDSGFDGRSFYVLSGTSLSKWQVSSFGQEKLLYQKDAGRMFREALSRKVWDKDSVQIPQLKTWLLDVQLTWNGLVLLGAGVDLETGATVHYALGHIEADQDDVHPSHFSDFVLIDYTQQYTEESEDQLIEYKLLLPTNSTNVLFIYNSNSILMLQDCSTLDKMDFRTAGDCLLGAGCHGGLAVFFSNNHGLFSVSPAGIDVSVLNESNNQGFSLSRNELSSIGINTPKLGEQSDKDDNKTKLNRAFVAFVSGDQIQAMNLVEELLLLAGGHQDESALDRIVAQASSDIIDDFPNADPRWAETKREDSSSSTASVIIIQQLKDKEKAHDLFVNFLKKSQVWNQLNVVSVRDSLMPTRLLLCEHVEKLEAALALRDLHAEHQKIIDSCIGKVLKQRRIVVPSTLTPQDVFYREVSSIQDIIEFVLQWERDFLASDHSSHSIVHTILAVNAILESMLHGALRYRQTHAQMYAGDTENIPEYIPWSATNSTRKTLVEQINIILSRAVPECRELDVQGVLFQNLVGLADILMDGYASQLKSLQALPDQDDDFIKLSKDFERERQKIISAILEHKQFDRAASLAEKFEDFEMLMRICDATNNHERLQRYHIQYRDKGFADFMFNWYTKEGKRGHLLSQPVAQGEELSKFLDSDNMKYLSWLHEIRQNNFAAAHKALLVLGKREQNFLSRKKTLLSLSKLSALASGNITENVVKDISDINDELDLILHQEQLPSETLEQLGMDPDNMRVLSPVDIIELFVGDKNTSPSELDVRKALDLLCHVDQSQTDVDALKLHIWCRAILMSNWIDGSDNVDPLESNRSKIFFKTAELVNMDNELQKFLPDLEQILAASELGKLRNNSKFQFLMKGGYEQIEKNSVVMDTE